MLFYIHEKLFSLEIVFLDILRIFLVILVLGLIVVMPIEKSYAQTPKDVSIFLQIQVRDSNGVLVSYMETHRITVTDLAKLNLLLDQNSPVFEKSIVTNGDQKFEVIKATDMVVISSGTIVSQNMMSGTNGQYSIVLAVADHDGYPVVPGDKVTAYWTLVRSAS
jgi:hypothetical protein